MSAPSELAALRLARLGPRSAAQMARALGISPSRLCRLETGESGPDTALLLRYAEVLRSPIREVRRRYWAGRLRWLRERLAEAERRAYG